MKKLKSTDEILDESFWTDEWDGTGDEIANLLTQDRNQAYTRLVKGIEGMMKEFVPAKNIQIGGMESDVWKLVPKEDGMYCLNCERFIHEEGCTCGMASLTDILENVVKPLYGKE